MKRSDRVCVSPLAGLPFGQCHITAHPADEVQPFAMFDALAECVQDQRAQIEKTMEVVAAILQSRGMEWSNTTRGIAYYKRAEDAATVRRCMREYTEGSAAIALAHADVCRPELLFELELDASAATTPPTLVRATSRLPCANPVSTPDRHIPHR
jgi:hypothetical protein